MNEAMNERAVDVAVIGGGTAGLAAYRAARAEGKRVLLVERGPYGTTCARVGCMPSKLLIAAADAAHRAKDALPFGIRTTVEIDGRAVMDRVKRERDRFVGFVLESVEAIPAETRIDGAARFEAPNLLSVTRPDGEIVRVHTHGVVVATGSSPVKPKMFEAAGDRAILSDQVFSWDTLPSSVAVFGAGVIGLELGQALARLGVRVRVFGRDGTVAHLRDPLVKGVAEAILGAEFPLNTDAKIEKLARTADGVTVGWLGEHGELREESFEYVLVAAGRRPNVDGLQLDKAGVPPNAKVDRHTQRLGDTSIFMAGDASEIVPLLHEASDEGRVAGSNAANTPHVRAYPRRSELAIAFTDPGCAVAGFGYSTVKARGPFAAGLVRFEDQGRSRVMRENRGALRVYGDPKTRRFLGAEMVAPRAEHLAHLLAWAHQQGLTVDEMLQMPFYHPVVEEGVRTALRDLCAKLDAGESLDAGE